MRDNTWLKRLLSMLAAMMMMCSVAFAADGVVNTSSLVLRKSADKSSKALQTLSRGDKLDIISSNGSWYKVRYGKLTGYVMKKYVKAGGTVKSTEKKTTEKKTTEKKTTEKKNVVNSGNTAKPGDTGSTVKKIQRKLKTLGFYDGSVDGDYGSATKKAVKAFQKKAGLSQNGTVNSATAKVLFGKNPPDNKLKTESLNWFNNVYKIPKGATVTIKDCYTGKTFKAVRWSGANHMDTEPKTKEDTAIMKSIYGGSWSWTRRPILVKYNGHVYAASMNGMPHGTSTRNNNFPGHFCVHFTNSKTHETKRVDSAHQNAVKKALKYKW